MRKHLHVMALIGLLCLCAAFCAGNALASEEMYYNDRGEVDIPVNEDWTDITALLGSEYPNVQGGELVLPSGWYVARGNVTFDKRVRVQGYVDLILCDDAELTMQKGIHLTGLNFLRIYGQSAHTGKLTAYAVTEEDASTAAIGGNVDEAGGQLYILGGEIYAQSNSYCAAIGGGGMGGNNTGRSSAGDINIYYGKVTAVCTGGGAGIGCGAGCAASDSYLFVSGGEVTAYSTYRYAGDGIGGNSVDNVGFDLVHIVGGKVTAYTTSTSAGQAINTDDNAGLRLGDDMRVAAGWDAGRASLIVTGVGSDGRINACRNVRYVQVEKCPHTDMAQYAKTPVGHTPTCSNCGVRFTEQAHTFDGHGICTVCGLPDHVPVTLQPGDAASGQSAVSIHADFGEYQLPECPLHACRIQDVHRLAGGLRNGTQTVGRDDHPTH